MDLQENKIHMFLIHLHLPLKNTVCKNHLMFWTLEIIFYLLDWEPAFPVVSLQKKKIIWSFWGAVRSPAQTISLSVTMKIPPIVAFIIITTLQSAKLNHNVQSLQQDIFLSKNESFKARVQHFPRHLLFLLTLNPFVCNQVKFNILYLISSW